MKLSICVPSIRVDNIPNLYSSLLESADGIDVELIIVTPFEIPGEIRDKVVVVTDHGCPTRCLQRGIDHASGDLFTWGSDDGLFVKGAIKEAVNLYQEKCGQKDAIIMRYTEGVGRPTHTKAHSNPKYWSGAPFNKELKGVQKHFLWGLLLIDTKYIKKIGGFDCSIEHCNYSVHDLCYRMQGDGSRLYLSPSFILNCDWNPNSEEYKSIHEANDHDLPLFQSMWRKPTDRFKIDFNNWENSPSHWRRFK